MRIFSYNRSVGASALLITSGICLLVPLVAEYYRFGYMLDVRPGRPNHLAILGLLFLISGFANFIFTLVLHAATLSLRPLRRKLR